MNTLEATMNKPSHGCRREMALTQSMFHHMKNAVDSVPLESIQVNLTIVERRQKCGAKPKLRPVPTKEQIDSLPPKAALLPLHGRLFAIVDEDLLIELSKFNWSFHKTWYVKRYAVINGVKTTVKLHDVVLNTPKGLYCDHISTNKLDNRAENLRISTACENARNRGLTRRNSTGWKGVSWNKNANKFEAYVTANRVRRYLGLFDDAEQAHQAYCAAAKELHGEFANFGSSGKGMA